MIRCVYMFIMLLVAVLQLYNIGIIMMISMHGYLWLWVTWLLVYMGWIVTIISHTWTAIYIYYVLSGRVCPMN